MCFFCAQEKLVLVSNDQLLLKNPIAFIYKQSLQPSNLVLRPQIIPAIGLIRIHDLRIKNSLFIQNFRGKNLHFTFKPKKITPGP